MNCVPPAPFQCPPKAVFNGVQCSFVPPFIEIQRTTEPHFPSRNGIAAHCAASETRHS
jgi:hypothetical protein